MHLLLALAPGITIRGTTTPHAPGQAFSVYDFIDAVCRPPRVQKKRGGFSRRMWSRLTSNAGRFKNELLSLSFEAPIRFSSERNRTFHVPVMTACGFLRLMVIINNESNPHRRTIDGRVGYTVEATLKTYLAGDRSMVREIEAVVVDSQTRVVKKKKVPAVATVNMPDLLLRLTPETVVRGTTTPGVPDQVFSVYDFIDVVGRQLSREVKCDRFSRRLWSRLISMKSDCRRELVHLSCKASIRCSLKSTRRILTPAMTVCGLHRLLVLLAWELRREYVNARGLPPHAREIDTTIRHNIETTFSKFKAGDHSMIQEIDA
jgi:hypothetical protein